MSLQKISSNEKSMNNSNIFLGKKIEYSEKCKLCPKKENLIKCIKCSIYYCNDCLNTKFKASFEEIKSDKYICPNCLKRNEDNINNKSLNINKCFICNKPLNENNFTCYNVTKEQKDKLKNEIIKITNNKDISLIEEDENNKINEEKNMNQKNLIKICMECNIINEEIIGKCFLLKKDKDKINHKKIMDELTNLIKKENGDNNINIFDILENKFEKSEDNSKDSNVTKKKQKDLFESIVINKTDKEKDNNIIKNKTKNITNNNINKNQSMPAININSNNKTSNIYLPNFFNIAQLQTNQNPNNQIINQNIPKNILNIPNLINNINPQNDTTSKSNINHVQNNKNNINNILNDINDMNNKINNSSQNLKDVKESINNLTNLNNPNNNMNTKSSIKDTLNKISICLHNFDINNIENNLNIINKIESLTNLISDLINEEKKEEINPETQKEEKLCININKNYKEIINNIHNSTESLKKQLKTLKAYTEMKKIYLSIIYQNIDIYLKEMNNEKNTRKISQINNSIPQPNINNMIPILNPISVLNNNLQGINLLNNIDINALSNNLIFPISPILPNTNNIANPLPIFNPQINIPNLLSQTRINSLGNNLFFND